jgi:phosphoribosyl-ATP pyrophosphohydrolase
MGGSVCEEAAEVEIAEAKEDEEDESCERAALLPRVRVLEAAAPAF